MEDALRGPMLIGDEGPSIEEFEYLTYLHPITGFSDDLYQQVHSVLGSLGDELTEGTYYENTGTHDWEVKAKKSDYPEPPELTMPTEVERQTIPEPIMPTLKANDPPNVPNTGRSLENTRPEQNQYGYPLPVLIPVALEFWGSVQEDWMTFRPKFQDLGYGRIEPDEQGKIALRACMRGLAAKKIEGIDYKHPGLTLSRLLNQYEHELTPFFGSRVSIARFNQAIQRETENLQEFHTRVDNLWLQGFPQKNIYPEERRRITRFLKGLRNPYTSMAIMNKEPLLYQTALELACQEEQEQARKYAQRVDTTPDPPIHQPRRRWRRWCNYCKKNGHLPSKCPLATVPSYSVVNQVPRVPRAIYAGLEERSEDSYRLPGKSLIKEKTGSVYKTTKGKITTMTQKRFFRRVTPTSTGEYPHLYEEVKKLDSSCIVVEAPFEDDEDDFPDDQYEVSPNDCRPPQDFSQRPSSYPC